MIIEFRLRRGAPPEPGEGVCLHVEAIMCLFPEHRQVRTIEHGWTLEVCEEDWDKVQNAFYRSFGEDGHG